MPSRTSPDPFDAPMSEALQALARRGELRRLRKGVQIITEGDRGDTLFIVLSGGLRAYSEGVDGREVTYAVYGPGEYVGEMSLDGGLRSASVETTAATLCAVVTRTTLERFLQERPAFAWELLAKVIRRARAATVGLRQIALNDVYGRLKALLEEVAVLQPDGSRLVQPMPTHNALAQQLGCSRPMVSRVLKDLERGGYVAPVDAALRLLRPLPAKW